MAVAVAAAAAAGPPRAAVFALNAALTADTELLAADVAKRRMYEYACMSFDVCFENFSSSFCCLRFCWARCLDDVGMVEFVATEPSPRVVQNLLFVVVICLHWSLC